MDNLETLLALGAENCHPKLIAKVDGQNEFVGEFVDGELHLTEHGRKLLKLQAEDADDEHGVTDAGKPAAKRTKAKVEPKGQEPDELDLG